MHRCTRFLTCKFQDHIETELYSRVLLRSDFILSVGFCENKLEALGTHNFEKPKRFSLWHGSMKLYTLQLGTENRYKNQNRSTVIAELYQDIYSASTA